MEAYQMNPKQSDISQIKIGQHTYGIVGLKHALEALGETQGFRGHPKVLKFWIWQRFSTGFEFDQRSKKT